MSLRRWCPSFLLLVLLITACDAPRPVLPTALIRVDQVGWTTGETKIAMLLAPGDAAGVTATVLDEDGDAVLTVTAGASRGAWNARLRAINPLDLTGLRRSGTFRVRLDDRFHAVSPPFRIGPAERLFAPLVTGAVHYFQAHRDGPDQVEGPWQRSTAHRDDRAATVYRTPADDDASLESTGVTADVSGGWFDAGDYLKFTHTTAYALVVMQLVERDGPAPEILAAEIRHGLDWLGRMYRDGVLYTQVGVAGNGHFLGDHDAWRLPEADDELAVHPGDRRYYQRYRPVFRAAAPGEPISPNLAGRVAAAFALAAQREAGTDPDRARSYLDTAAAIFDRADTDPGGDLVTTVPRSFYPEESWADDLALGATELALAGTALGDGRTAGWTGQATRWADDAGGGDDGLTVYDVAALADAELYRLTPVASLAADLRQRLDGAVEAAGADPMGATSGSGGADWTARQFGWAAAAGLYRRMTGDDRYAGFATAQRGTALGRNGWGVSLVIGAGTDFPRCPHDQIGTLTGVPMTGGVVNGPNAADRVESLEQATPETLCSAGSYPDFDRPDAQYVDDMRVSATNEPSIDFTATGMLAFALVR
ncbi:glycoside hydrolase family 9 protein [Actinoplanes oblitus]|uniref:Glycoside hydrolase family 9 protein n=1 Tax=Actinoplanes oblitus TaxID=3040509 RepID=A0ABY8WI39_9ACTN|nr:glycoside hydrolase family 9 protein [Actinoplanes oblitus]WIM97480.1 glycoside hydrolase family 9 protein [Actinoplanes oblitus]